MIDKSESPLLGRKYIKPDEKEKGVTYFYVGPIQTEVLFFGKYIMFN